MNETKLTPEQQLLLKVDALWSILWLQDPDEVGIVSQSISFLFVEGGLTNCRASVTSLTETWKARVHEILKNTQLERDVIDFVSTGTHNLATIAIHIGRPYFERHIVAVLERLIQEDKVLYLNFWGWFYTIKKTA